MGGTLLQKQGDEWVVIGYHSKRLPKSAKNFGVTELELTRISGTMITMPDTAYVSIFTDNDLTHITEGHFEIKLIARLLDQMYVIQPPVFPPRHDDALPSAPQFPEHLHSFLTRS